MSNNTDIAISPSSTTEVKANNQKALVPTYLVRIKAIDGKGTDNFVAVRYDGEHPAHAKFVGFFCNEKLSEIPNRFEALVQNAPKNDFIELMIPWAEIRQIRSLVYRHR